MSWRIKGFFSLLAASLLLPLCACGREAAPVTPGFPAAPDRVVIGAQGQEKTLLPGDADFDGIVSSIRGRAEKSERMNTASLIAHDPDTGTHLSEELRKNETFVEFVYDEGRTQSFPMAQAGGGTEQKEYTVWRLFFSLTGNYHNCVFVGMDAEYKSAATLGIIADDTALISRVRALTTQTAS